MPIEIKSIEEEVAVVFVEQVRYFVHEGVAYLLDCSQNK